MVLLESLIHHTLEKRSLIIKHVEEINIDRNLVSSRWIKYVPQVVFSPGKVSAVDGSFNLMAFRGFILYAVNAQSLVYGNDGFIDKFDKFEVELAYPTEYSLDFIKMSMSLMELTVLWESLEKYNPDFALVDGSLIAYLTRIFSRIKQGVDEELYTYIRNILRDSVLEFYSEAASLGYNIEEVFRALTYSRIIDFYKIMGLILEKYWRNIIAISKTSISRRYFKYSLKPDLVVFSKTISEAGFSEPQYYSTEELVKDEIISTYIKPRIFTVFYARLERGGSVYRFEIPYEASENEIKLILDNLQVFSVNGYPYPLMKAHNNVEIGADDMLRIYKILSIYPEETGRGVLK